jgi:hypothetical protein
LRISDAAQQVGDVTHDDECGRLCLRALHSAEQEDDMPVTSNSQALPNLGEGLRALRAKPEWIVVLGVIFIIAGVIALGSVVVATASAVIIIGIMLIMAGVAEIIAAFNVIRRSDHRCAFRGRRR